MRDGRGVNNRVFLEESKRIHRKLYRKIPSLKRMHYLDFFSSGDSGIVIGDANSHGPSLTLLKSEPGRCVDESKGLSVTRW